MFRGVRRFAVFEVTRKGSVARFESALSDVDVRAQLPRVRGDLAKQLLERAGAWSEKQRAWAHFLVQDAANAAQRSTPQYAGTTRQRFVVTKAGEPLEFESNLTDDQARDVIREHWSELAQSLAAKKAWTGPQRGWAHHLALQLGAKRTPTPLELALRASAGREAAAKVGEGCANMAALVGLLAAAEEPVQALFAAHLRPVRGGAEAAVKIVEAVLGEEAAQRGRVWSYALQHGTGEEAAQGLARRCATLAELQELVGAGGWRAQEALREAGVANPGRLIGFLRPADERAPCEHILRAAGVSKAAAQQVLEDVQALADLPGAVEDLPQAERVRELAAQAASGSNARLLRVLQELRDLAPDAHRRRAYRRAAESVEQYPVTVVADVATWIPGVGPSIADTVREVLASGRSTKLEELRAAKKTKA